ncbi:hypothetical protein [Picrophilus oshimae]|uniref:Uncharacterized protein n=1 Tax=Picrophilus torridus (strain ATCC 700027 / DSM 9790 / JCM 10055 / NBRC 100828 / KAW 2/3) TaxID=1122961 RepID=Q6L1T5_PICTO|nr:hypothetical protein [Picrophilus oshimae]AAT43067.1 hypothetical protein PTO0482 [Picrophilus oshimae DSM 9789]
MRVIATYEYTKQFIKHDGSLENRILGKCLDDVVSGMVYYSGYIKRDISLKAIKKFIAEFKSETKSNELKIENMDFYINTAWRFIHAFKGSEIYKNRFMKEKTRLIVINGDAGVYAQPDFIDYNNKTFYEMKSFSVRPAPLYVIKQVRIFQLAYPDFKSYIIGIPRDKRYIRIQRVRVNESSERTKKSLLKSLYNYAMENGRDIDYKDAIFKRHFTSYSV